MVLILLFSEKFQAVRISVKRSMSKALLPLIYVNIQRKKSLNHFGFQNGIKRRKKVTLVDKAVYLKHLDYGEK
jgi:hypothetical protein